MKDMIKKFVSDERGLETVEYAIITGLIVAGTIAIIASIGRWVQGEFTTLDTELANPSAPPTGG
jgi:Flp pilus assembly pilin Flp